MINLGSGYYVARQVITTILDKEIFQGQAMARQLEEISKEDRIIETCSLDKVKSYVCCYRDSQVIIYTSSFTAKTLAKRFEEEDWRF